MDARDTLLTNFLGSESQFYVPIYQRSYSWNKDNCLKLIQDIISVAEDKARPCHFIGSVIYLAKLKQDARHASAIQEYLVIDGQQRLTTMSLILLALGDYTKVFYRNSEDYAKAATALEKLQRKYLINEDEIGDTYYKLRLNDEDFYAWTKLLQNRAKPENIKWSKIFENYQFIYKTISDSKIDPQVVFEGIKKLKLVDICLLPKDNAQLVFETVNSTGLPLTSADKIRNFILMTVDPMKQTQLYQEYWHPMEKALGVSEGITGRFNDFFKYYMTVVLQREVGEDNYDAFKNYYYKNYAVGTETLVKQIQQYSKYYMIWCDASERGTRLQQALCRVKNTNMLKVSPVILKLLSDRDNCRISDDDTEEILKLIESYWVRRAVLGLPTNTAGPVCISMLKSLYNDDPVASLRQNLLSLTYAQRMPDDAEIKSALKTANIYQLKSGTIAKLILSTIENHDRKEPISTSEYTIEHIMPQTLSEEWKKDLGEDATRIHETYVHTIGNLTLTGYNSEYQNRRFVDKLDCSDKQGNRIGYRHTPIRISSYLTTVSKWGEDEILTRTEIIATALTKIWQYPRED